MSSSPDHLPSKLSITNFSVKSKFVFSLSSRDFVNTEELPDGLEEAGVLEHHVLHRLHVLLGRLQSIEGENLPVRLTAVQQAEDSQDLQHKHCGLPCKASVFTLTGTTLPVGKGLDPSSQTSMGSLSPRSPVQGSLWKGFSQV